MLLRLVYKTMEEPPQELKKIVWEALQKTSNRPLRVQELTNVVNGLNDTIGSILEILAVPDRDAIFSRLIGARDLMIAGRSEDIVFDPTKYVYIEIAQHVVAKLSKLDFSSVECTCFDRTPALRLIHGEQLDIVPLWRKMKIEDKRELQPYFGIALQFAARVEPAATVCDYDVRGLIMKYMESGEERLKGKPVIRRVITDIVDKLIKRPNKVVEYFSGQSQSGLLALSMLISSDLADNPFYSNMSASQIVSLTREILDIALPEAARDIDQDQDPGPAPAPVDGANSPAPIPADPAPNAQVAKQVAEPAVSSGSAGSSPAAKESHGDAKTEDAKTGREHDKHDGCPPPAGGLH
jgi:hypothetical protein